MTAAGTHVVFGTGPAGQPRRLGVRHAFGGHTTHWADIVASTVDWYRAHAAQPEFSTGLAEATTLEVAA